MLTDNGMFDGRRAKAVVEAPQEAEQLLQGIELSEASRLCVRMSLEQRQALSGQKQLLRRQIYGFGRPLEAQVRLLIGIRGITPLRALGGATHTLQRGHQAKRPDQSRHSRPGS